MQAWENGMGDIRMIKGGAFLEAPLKGKNGRRWGSRSQGHQQRSRGLWERRGGKKQEIQSKKVRNYAWQDNKQRYGCSNAMLHDTGKGGNIRESFTGVRHFRTDETHGKGCMFAMLGRCGGRTGCVSGFVLSFWATFMYKVFSSELRFIFYDFSKFKQYYGIPENWLSLENCSVFFLNFTWLFPEGYN